MILQWNMTQTCSWRFHEIPSRVITITQTTTGSKLNAINFSYLFNFSIQNGKHISLFIVFFVLFFEWKTSSSRLSLLDSFSQNGVIGSGRPEWRTCVSRVVEARQLLDWIRTRNPLMARAELSTTHTVSNPSLLRIWTLCIFPAVLTARLW